MNKRNAILTAKKVWPTISIVLRPFFACWASDTKSKMLMIDELPGKVAALCRQRISSNHRKLITYLFDDFRIISRKFTNDKIYIELSILPSSIKHLGIKIPRPHVSLIATKVIEWFTVLLGEAAIDSYLENPNNFVGKGEIDAFSYDLAFDLLEISIRTNNDKPQLQAICGAGSTR